MRGCAFCQPFLSCIPPLFFFIPHRTPLHRALHFGHTAAAAALLAAGARTAPPDARGRTPVDLLAARLAPGLAAETAAGGRGGPGGPCLPGGGDAFAWGDGGHWALGTGGDGGSRAAPARVGLGSEGSGGGGGGGGPAQSPPTAAAAPPHSRVALAVAAAKFHSAAIVADGRPGPGGTLLTWGASRGGRLGHAAAAVAERAGGGGGGAAPAGGGPPAAAAAPAPSSAAIAPTPVALPPGVRVTAVALGKHHSLALADGGGVWAWGSNADGRCGLPPSAAASLPTPRRVPGLRGVCVTSLAAANRHSVACDSAGRVWTWGANQWGQLGHGLGGRADGGGGEGGGGGGGAASAPTPTPDASSAAGGGPTPRRVEALPRGVTIVAVAAAKRHTLALGACGGVWGWGHGSAVPRRVQLGGGAGGGGGGGGAAAPPAAQLDAAGAPAPAFDARARDGTPLALHRGAAAAARPVAVAIAAGAAHSVAVTSTGALLAWRSTDPAARVEPVGGSLAGRRVVSAAAGKYWTAAVTACGAVWMFDGWSRVGDPPAPPPGRAGGGGGPPPLTPAPLLPTRVPGLTRIAGVAVGEKHSLALQAWSAAPLAAGRRGGGGGSILEGAGAAAAAPGGGGGGGARAEVDECGGSPQAHPDPAAAAAAVSLSPLSGRATPRSAAAAAHWAALEAAGGGGSPFQALAAHPGSPATLARRCPALPSSSSPRLPTRRSLARGPPTLQALAERAVAAWGVEPRTALPAAALAEALGARTLAAHAAAVGAANLDAVIVEARACLAGASPGVLARLWDALAAVSPAARPSAAAAVVRVCAEEEGEGAAGCAACAAPPASSATATPAPAPRRPGRRAGGRGSGGSAAAVRGPPRQAAPPPRGGLAAALAAAAGMEAGAGPAAAPTPPPPPPPPRGPARKGGLSAFLAGDLDGPPTPPSGSGDGGGPAAAAGRPAWGGGGGGGPSTPAPPSRSALTGGLAAIQAAQVAASSAAAAGRRRSSGTSGGGGSSAASPPGGASPGGGLAIPLHSLLGGGARASAPIPAACRPAAWGGSGTAGGSPPAAAQPGGGSATATTPSPAPPPPRLADVMHEQQASRVVLGSSPSAPGGLPGCSSPSLKLGGGGGRAGPRSPWASLSSAVAAPPPAGSSPTGLGSSRPGAYFPAPATAVGSSPGGLPGCSPLGRWAGSASPGGGTPPATRRSAAGSTPASASRLLPAAARVGGFAVTPARSLGRG